MVLLGSAFAIYGIYNGVIAVCYAVASEKWPSTYAQIRESHVKVNKGMRLITYSPFVSYEYSVDGAYLSSSHIYPGNPLFMSSVFAEKTVNQYRPGSQWLIRYSPENHGNAVLIPGLNFLVVSPLLMGVWFSGRCILGVFLLNKEINRYNSDNGDDR